MKAEITYKVYEGSELLATYARKEWAEAQWKAMYETLQQEYGTVNCCGKDIYPPILDSSIVCMNPKKPDLKDYLCYKLKTEITEL